jgi:hypothetical protein
MSKKLFWCLVITALIGILLLRNLGVVHLSQAQPGTIEANLPIQSAATNTPVYHSIATAPTNGYQRVLDSIEQAKQEDERIMTLAQLPLMYYGKVLDENNQPISGVQVSYTAHGVNQLLQEIFDKGTVMSDERGIFKISGINGIGLMLDISHPNYYPYPDNSTGFDKRSLPRKGYYSDSEEKAELFRMHSKGHPVPLTYRTGGFHAPSNGISTSYPLRGNTRAQILGYLQFSGWSGLRSETYPYDWKVQIKSPNVGIVEATNYFDYVAPETGYSDTVTIEVSGNESVRKTYFLKVPAGYIRFKLEVIMVKGMFVTADYDFNPDGSRNLEPSQEIQPSQ